MARGSTSAEIARALGLSYHTVCSYLERIYRKLGVSSRVEAVNAVRRSVV
jgi:DNA-binding CsgD family transcriptional regulator